MQQINCFFLDESDELLAERFTVYLHDESVKHLMAGEWKKTELTDPAMRAAWDLDQASVDEVKGLAAELGHSQGHFLYGPFEMQGPPLYTFYNYSIGDTRVSTPVKPPEGEGSPYPVTESIVSLSEMTRPPVPKIAVHKTIFWIAGDIEYADQTDPG